MNCSRHKNADAQLEALIRGRRFRRVLNVGAYAYKTRVPNGLERLRQIADEIDCLEIWPKHVRDVCEKEWFDKVICGDVLRWRNRDDSYDLVFWWHGPEHLVFELARYTLLRLTSEVDNVWVCSPWGKNAHGSRWGNVHQEHRSTWLPEDYERIGYSASVSGRANAKTGNIVAWHPADRVPL